MTRRRRLRARLKQLRRRRPRNPDQLHVAVVNLDKDKPGDRLYIWLVIWAMLRLGGRGVICLVETKQGRENVRLIGVGIRLRKRRMVPVGNVGVHRDVEIAEIRLGRRRPGLRRRRHVGVVVNHAPHRKTIANREDPTGQRGQDTYFVALKEDVLNDFDTVIQAGDQNNAPANVAAIVGGTPFGAPGDVMGGTVRGGLVIVHEWATDIGRDPKRGWTTHREAWVTVQLTT